MSWGITWAEDERSFVLDDEHFVVEPALRSEVAVEPLAERSHTFYKPKGMVDAYERMFEQIGPRRTETILELGIWKGGSVVFWSKVLAPSVHIAIDHSEEPDLPSLRQHLTERRDDAAHLYWRVDQSDRRALAQVLADHGNPELDLVIDDASHKYRQTVASFNALFGRIRAGGLFVIEDWAWSLDDEFVRSHPHWKRNASLVGLVLDLHELMARDPEGIESIHCTPHFVAVRRGTSNTVQHLVPATTPSWNRRAKIQSILGRGSGKLRSMSVALARAR